MMAKKTHVAFLLLLITISIVSCDNDNVEISQLTGTWTIWNDDPNLAVDSSVDYTFNHDGTCVIYTSSFIEDSSQTFLLKYIVNIDNRTLIIYKNNKDNKGNEVGEGQYHIAKLTSKGMVLESMDNRNSSMKLRKQ